MSFNFVIPELQINGAGTPPLQFYKRGFRLGSSGYTPEWREVTVSGTNSVVLANSLANSLLSLKLFGGTEQLAETYIDSVTAEGKCAQRNLPEGYTQLEYIKSNGTQYIDTGINQTTLVKPRIITKYKINVGEDKDWFGGSNDGGGGGIIWNIAPNTTRIAYTRWKTQSARGITFESGYSERDLVFLSDFHTLDVGGVEESGVVPIIVDNNLIGNMDSTTTLNWVNHNLLIFRSGRSGQNGTCLFSYFTIYSNDIKVWDGVACRRNSDNVLGMYDLVSGQFFTNAGTGTFTAGSDVSPTPSSPVDIYCNNGVIKANKNLVTGSLAQGIFDEDGVLNTSVTTWIAYNTAINVQSGKQYTLEATPSVSGKTIVCNIMKYLNGNYIGYTSTANVPYSFTPDNTYNSVKFQMAYNPRENITPSSVSDVKLYENGSIYVQGTTETITDNQGNVATCTNLLSVDSYKDTQEILSGTVTRNIGIKIMTGDETFQSGTNGWISEDTITNNLKDVYTPICTHFGGTDTTPTADSNTVRVYYTSQNVPRVYFGVDKTIYTSAEVFKQFLADQYAQGTPVIIVYPLETATTESVSGQQLNKTPLTYAGSVSGLTGTAVTSSHTTPTPTQPLQLNCNNGVLKYGNVSKNLFDEDYPNVSNSMKYLPIYLGVGTYTCSYSFPHNESGTSLIYFLNGNASSGAGNGVNQVDASHPRTVNSSTGYVTIAYRNGSGIGLSGAVPSDYNCMIEKGETATPYEPYRLAVYTDGTTEKVEVHSKNLFDEQWNRNTGTSTAAATWGQVVTASGWSTSGLVPVKGGQQYTVSYNTTVAIYVFYYESDGTMQQSYDYATSNTKKTFTVPDGATHIRLQVNKSTETQIAELETQLELGSTDTTYEPYFNGGQATAQDLYAVGTYKDVQSVLNGAITRNVGIKVLDGSKSWTVATTNVLQADILPNNAYGQTCICSHLQYTTSGTLSGMPENSFRNGSATYPNRMYVKSSTLATDSTTWTNYLKDQYNSGNPVIVIYPLATATTESVTGQTLTTQAGTNIVEITQSSMDNLGLEVSYKATL